MKTSLFVLALLLLTLLGVRLIGPGVLENQLNVVKPHEPYTISDQARRLHDSLFIVDLHTDSLLWQRGPGTGS